MKKDKIQFDKELKAANRRHVAERAGCNWMCYKNRYSDLAKLSEAEAADHWLKHGKSEKRKCVCQGLICMQASPQVGRCTARLQKLKKHVSNLKQHRKDMNNAVKRQKAKKKFCHPAGTKHGARGGAAVVELVLDTTPACSGKTVVKNNSFWQQKKKRSCRFSIAITLTKKADMTVNSGPGAALVQSYAAVADAKGDPRCSEFIWVADMIARDALSETRFDLAEQLLA